MIMRLSSLIWNLGLSRPGIVTSGNNGEEGRVMVMAIRVPKKEYCSWKILVMQERWRRVVVKRPACVATLWWQ
ncbi:hypothetical protein R6Q59_021776 [Mikania micrantha]